MNKPSVKNCPCCGGPMKGQPRLEECWYCNSTIEWYKGPEMNPTYYSPPFGMRTYRAGYSPPFGMRTYRAGQLFSSNYSTR